MSPTLTSNWAGALPEPVPDRQRIITRGEVLQATVEAERLGIDCPIEDELELGPYKPEEKELPGEVTSDEEFELPGTRRPQKGEGWWGFGPPFKPLRKGIPRDFVDGAGLCSSGRWPIQHRRLPDDFTSKRLQKVVFEGLLKCEKLRGVTSKGLDMKRMLMNLGVVCVEEMPFDHRVLEEVRVDLRIICKEAGHGDGLPREGDVVQLFKIRLIQSLLSAFQDPDAHFCEWWAKGTRLGSKSRKLPRASAVFDRKARWRKIDPSDEMHGGWQKNDPSLVELATLVQKQFEIEEAEGLTVKTTVGEATP